MFKLVSFTIAIFFLSGCSSRFLQNEFVFNLSNPSDNTSKIIFYEENYNYSDLDDVREIERTVIKVGLELKSLPDFLMVHESSMNKVISYNARILNNAEGQKESFSKNDLYKYNYSSRRQISESSIRFLPVDKYIKPGDIIEVVVEYKNLLPQLGVYFQEPENMAPKAEYRCIVNIPDTYIIGSKLSNGFPEPEIVNEKNRSIKYIYKNQSVLKKETNNTLAKKQDKPGVLITYPVSSKENSSVFSWTDFGNWYFDLFEKKTIPGEKIKQTTDSITAGATDDLQKIEAIFNYCQQKVRYEQVYLPLGEFIPNDCTTILERGYGDCKDYATLIYTMAKSIGIKTSVALCYRGRGIIDFENIAVSQFNHMIAYYQHDNKDYWLDGTNRSCKPGTTTPDLINQTALIIENNNSHTRKIENLEANQVTISGKLNASKSDLSGELLFNISGQYASEMFFFNFIMNKQDLHDYLHSWLKEYFNPNIIIQNVTTEKNTDTSYSINVKCVLPNSLVRIDSMCYFSTIQAFPSIIPYLPNSYKEKDIFYYPNISNVKMDIEISNLYKNNSTALPYQFNQHWKLDPGPFSSDGKISFLKSFKELQNQLSQKFKLQQKDIL